LGALDGKHITIEAPSNCGSLYFNYKKTFSIVLLALVDAQYNVIAVDVGAYGKKSDGGISGNSNLGKALQLGTLPIPGNAALPDTSIEAQNYSFFWTFSVGWYSREHDVSETGSVSVLR
jgi:hypothetical protein